MIVSSVLTSGLRLLACRCCHEIAVIIKDDLTRRKFIKGDDIIIFLFGIQSRFCDVTIAGMLEPRRLGPKYPIHSSEIKQNANKHVPAH